MFRRSGIARGNQCESCWVGSRVREDGSGDSRRDGGGGGYLCGKFFLGGKSCRRGKLECTEELASAKRFPARARLPTLWQYLWWGLGFKLLLLLTVLRESHVEGTTFSGGLPPYVSNRLVDLMIE